MNIILETPFKNENKQIFVDNYLYTNAVARKLMKEDNVSSLFFHTFYTQFLNDNDPSERDLGLKSSFNYHSGADCKVYAIDRGLSNGMILGAKDAIMKNIEINFYSVVYKDRSIIEELNIINSKSDNNERLELAIKFVEKLSQTEFAKNNKTGQLIDYNDSLSEHIVQVKDCLTEFFQPILDGIK